jgi:N-acetylglucosaminyldiphosphoundecaprenol N-acetyl-beta-D-mannosaminyltransferase
VTQILSLISGGSAVARSATNTTGSSRRHVRVMGVPIVDLTMDEAIRIASEAAGRTDVSHPTTIFFANAHTLNLAYEDHAFNRSLCKADYVFGDGTGVRWASRMRGRKLADNVNGTDFTPALLGSASFEGRSYFMLGADEPTVARAADVARRRFPRCRLAGFHHGFVHAANDSEKVIERINLLQPDLLLVGMGNPIQELWVERYRDAIQAKVCLGVGGLFDFWSGNVSRAPSWLRQVGHEWLWRLWQQPKKKAKRYVIGNPLYLIRSMSCAIEDLRMMT